MQTCVEIFHDNIGRNLTQTILATYLSFRKQKFTGLFSKRHYLKASHCSKQAFIFFLNLRIQSEYRKKQTRKNFVFQHFSRSVCLVCYHMGYHLHNNHTSQTNSLTKNSIDQLLSEFFGTILNFFGTDFIFFFAANFDSFWLYIIFLALNSLFLGSKLNVFWH